MTDPYLLGWLETGEESLRNLALLGDWDSGGWEDEAHDEDHYRRAIGEAHGDLVFLLDFEMESAADWDGSERTSLWGMWKLLCLDCYLFFSGYSTDHRNFKQRLSESLLPVIGTMTGETPPSFFATTISSSCEI